MNHDLHTGRPERRPVGTIAFPDGADFAPEMISTVQRTDFAPAMIIAALEADFAS